jgi:hypothetical protein
MGGIDVAKFGDKAIIVSLLKPNTTYYFRLIPFNGCASGPWSNEVSIKSGGRYTLLTNSIKNTVTGLVNKLTGNTNIVSPTPTSSTVPVYNAPITAEPAPVPQVSLFTRILRFFGFKL